jgi:hypothetical protein
LSVWEQDWHVVVEVYDRGNPIAVNTSQAAPHLRWRLGDGLRLTQRLCDLVQIRSSDAGTTVRLHFALGRQLPTAV